MEDALTAEQLARLEEMSAKQEIRDLLLTYCRGIDRCEIELVKRAFWEDAYDNHGAFAAPAWQFAADIIESKLTKTTWTTHSVTNHLVELEGERAFSEAIIFAYQKSDESDDIQMLAGRYVDRWERRGGEWRIAYRNLVHDWSGSLSLRPWSLSSVPPDAFLQGGRQSDDIVTGPQRAEMMSEAYRPDPRAAARATAHPHE